VRDINFFPLVPKASFLPFLNDDPLFFLSKSPPFSICRIMLKLVLSFSFILVAQFGGTLLPLLFPTGKRPFWAARGMSPSLKCHAANNLPSPRVRVVVPPHASNQTFCFSSFHSHKLFPPLRKYGLFLRHGNYFPSLSYRLELTPLLPFRHCEFAWKPPNSYGCLLPFA